jgi:hypothetical protein
MEKQYLNEKQVSEAYGFALSTLRNWRFLGRGPAYSKCGGKAIRYSIQSLEEFMERHRIDPQAHHG